MRFTSAIFLFFLLSISLVSAATLQGIIYNSDLEPETDVLVQINTTPAQKLLAKQGSYKFEIPPGVYAITVTKGFLQNEEKVKITQEGNFVYDIFLIPDFSEEEDLLTPDELPTEQEQDGYAWWRYALAGVVLGLALWRFLKYRRKYGPIRVFRAKVKTEQKRSVEEFKQAVEEEPSYLEN